MWYSGVSLPANLAQIPDLHCAVEGCGCDDMWMCGMECLGGVFCMVAPRRMRLAGAGGRVDWPGIAPKVMGKITCNVDGEKKRKKDHARQDGGKTSGQEEITVKMHVLRG